ncbi:hypothetical protein ABIC28_005180 [Rhodococcus sp. PvR044]|uniref:hypothetical protein n=1 Tax=Rhodococcus sp. PvR044 TaxID=3156402 RepID=UPI003396581B
MASWRQWVVWLPVSVAFGITITMASFGLDSLDDGPATLLFLITMCLIGTVQGLVIGLIAILARKLAVRAVTGPLSTWSSTAKIAVYAIAAAGAVAMAVGLYMSIAASASTNSPSIVWPAAFVAAVAAASSAAASVRERTA